MERIQMGHGSGGRMMHRLVREYFAPQFEMRSLTDSAIVAGMQSGRVAITTDSYVVSPLFFPGGDIGKLAVCGTVNDLSVSGARPLYLTAGFIIEEGFPVEDLRKIIVSMKTVSDEAGVKIIAGDTKVVDKGKADGLFINTSGYGIVEDGVEISPRRIRPGDKVVLSGSIGNHGMSIMALRNGITFEPELKSDVRPLNRLVGMMLEAPAQVRMMRDPTRGGLATTLKEIAEESDLCIRINEDRIVLKPGVRGACELLGLDPLYVANEGILIAIVESKNADTMIDAMRRSEEGSEASIIGEVIEKPAKTVLLKTKSGGIRIVDMLSGDQLPRIC